MGEGSVSRGPIAATPPSTVSSSSSSSAKVVVPPLAEGAVIHDAAERTKYARAVMRNARIYNLLFVSLAVVPLVGGYFIVQWARRNLWRDYVDPYSGADCNMAIPTAAQRQQAGLPPSAAASAVDTSVAVGGASAAVSTVPWFQHGSSPGGGYAQAARLSFGAVRRPAASNADRSS